MKERRRGARAFCHKSCTPLSRAEAKTSCSRCLRGHLERGYGVYDMIVRELDPCGLFVNMAFTMSWPFFSVSLAEGIPHILNILINPRP